MTTEAMASGPHRTCPEWSLGEQIADQGADHLGDWSLWIAAPVLGLTQLRRRAGLPAGTAEE